MKFLFITQNYPPNKGGMAVSCDRLIKNFRKKGIEIHIIHFTNRNKKFVTQSNIKGSYSAVPITKSEEFTLSLCSEFILQLPFLNDITHIVAFGSSLSINIAPIISKWTENPLITFIRGNDFDEGIFSKRRDKLLYALKNSKYIFTVTNEKKEKINKLIHQKNAHFTPNGINRNLWDASKSHQKKITSLKSQFQKKTIAVVGQLKIKKGIINFCEVFNKFPYKEEYTLCFIGDIDYQTKETISAYNIDVAFFPFTNQNELLIYYYACDIFAIPSFYDGMPNVLLEAGITKNLVIASNVGGIKDVIEHKKDGFLYNPLHPTELIDVLLKIHRLSDTERQNIIVNLFTKITTSFTEEKEITNYLKILYYEN